MDFEDYGDFGDDDLFDDKDKPTDELNDDEVLNSVIKKTEPKDGKKKRTVSMKPRPKLTEHILTGPKGLCALRKLFEKWNPHENKNPYDNLDEMMQKIEYWGHLLYPKSNFDDLLAKVENLGKKRAVKVYMTKLRLGMPLFEELDEKEGEKVNDRRSESPAADRAFSPLPDDEDDFNNEAWDKLFEDPSEKQNKPKSKNSELKKKLHKLVADSSSDDDDEGSKSSHSDNNDMDEDSELNSIFNDALAANQNKTTTQPKKSHNNQKKQRIVLDSDEEDSDGEPSQSSLKDKAGENSDDDEDAPVRTQRSVNKSKRIIVESDEEDEPKSQTSEQDINKIDEDSALNSIFNEALAANKVTAPSSVKKSQNRRIMLDSDDEDEEYSVPQTQASSDKENAPSSHVKPSTQSKRLIIESDEENDEEEKDEQQTLSTQETESNKRAFNESGKNQEGVPSPLSESPANKRRKILLDSDDENDEQQPQSINAKELTVESALDFIFDD